MDILPKQNPPSGLICPLNAPVVILSLNFSRAGEEDTRMAWGSEPWCGAPKLTLSWQWQARNTFFLLSILGK